MEVNNYLGQREKMVRVQIEARGIKDERVLAAMRRVPRHLFVPESMRHRAYEDSPLPIGQTQTISQPYTVAAMTEALGLEGGEVVLEIGTGSGYQTAVLAELCEWVYSIERLRDLAALARKTLEELKYDNVAIRVGDGTLGWRERGPFDAILVTAGAPEIPKPLTEQLKEGGRLVIPVGGAEGQTLMLGTMEDGRLETEGLGPYRFVDLIGAYGWKG
jgi:protein-L-isoaspartate(D-aspartate) O-methyltransferase